MSGRESIIGGEDIIERIGQESVSGAGRTSGGWVGCSGRDNEGDKWFGGSDNNKWSSGSDRRIGSIDNHRRISNNDGSEGSNIESDGGRGRHHGNRRSRLAASSAAGSSSGSWRPDGGESEPNNAVVVTDMPRQARVDDVVTRGNGAIVGITTNRPTNRQAVLVLREDDPPQEGVGAFSELPRGGDAIAG